IVFTISAMHPDDGGLVTVRLGICRRSTECLGPIGGESFDMVGAEAMAERMSHYLVSHHTSMPGRSKAAQAVVSTHCFEDGFHSSMLTSGGFGNSQRSTSDMSIYHQLTKCTDLHHAYCV